MLPFLMLLCCASALDGSRFRFASQPRLFRQTDDLCQMCYGAFDCLFLERAQCEYNADADAIFNDVKEEEFTNDSVKKDVDTLMYDLLLKDSINEDFRECIPFVSSYTDCHRGNVCTGCTRCECNSEGLWNCSAVQQCRHEGATVNHRVLALVMENVRSATTDHSNRYKRSEAPEDTKKQKVSPEELIEWIYGGKLIPWEVSEKPHAATERSSTLESTTALQYTTDPIAVIRNDTSKNLGFDEVLHEIDVDFKMNESAGIIILHKSNSSDTEHFLEMLAVEEGKDVAKPTTNDTGTVVDLLSENNNLGFDAGYEINNSAVTKYDKLQDIDFNRDLDGMGLSNFVNVMKRDIHTSTLAITARPIIATTAKTSLSNFTSNMTLSEKLSMNEVLDPVTKMIEDKHKEIETLTNLRKSIIYLFKSCKFNSTFYNESQVSTSNSDINVDIDISSYFRRKFGKGNVAISNKYVNKLKRDINEVIRDIIGIRKYQSSSVLSKDLKLLLQAIKYYMKSNKLKLKENKIQDERKIRKNNPRRVFDSSNVNVNYVKEALLFILEVIDRDMPLKNALSPLSPGAKKLINRVINNNYVDDSAVIGFRIHDPYYDMATDLKSMEFVNWHELSSNIANAAPADRLYNMLLLHFRLSQQITKLRDALALLKFANSRRMSGIEENVGIEILEGVNANLKTINYEINRFINKRNKNDRSKKMSLLKKIKKLLSSSKNSMLKILRKKQTSPVADEFNRQILEQKLKKIHLQDHFPNYPLRHLPLRSKRSLREYVNQKNRMKNIIPQYLRGKLDPAIQFRGKGIKKKISSRAARPKGRNPVYSKKNIVTATAKTKSTTARNKITRRN